MAAIYGVKEAAPFPQCSRAPLHPSVAAAIRAKSTPSSQRILPMCTRKISARCTKSGRGMCTCRPRRRPICIKESIPRDENIVRVVGACLVCRCHLCGYTDVPDARADANRPRCASKTWQRLVSLHMLAISQAPDKNTTTEASSNPSRSAMMPGIHQHTMQMPNPSRNGTREELPASSCRGAAVQDAASLAPPRPHLS